MRDANQNQDDGAGVGFASAEVRTFAVPVEELQEKRKVWATTKAAIPAAKVARRAEVRAQPAAGGTSQERRRERRAAQRQGGALATAACGAGAAGAKEGSGATASTGAAGAQKCRDARAAAGATRAQEEGAVTAAEMAAMMELLQEKQAR